MSDFIVLKKRERLRNETKQNNSSSKNAFLPPLLILTASYHVKEKVQYHYSNSTIVLVSYELYETHFENNFGLR